MFNSSSRPSGAPPSSPLPHESNSVAIIFTPCTSHESFFYKFPREQTIVRIAPLNGASQGAINVALNSGGYQRKARCPRVVWLKRSTAGGGGHVFGPQPPPPSPGAGLEPSPKSGPGQTWLVSWVNTTWDVRSLSLYRTRRQTVTSRPPRCSTTTLGVLPGEINGLEGSEGVRLPVCARLRGSCTVTSRTGSWRLLPLPTWMSRARAALGSSHAKPAVVRAGTCGRRGWERGAHRERAGGGSTQGMHVRGQIRRGCKGGLLGAGGGGGQSEQTPYGACEPKDGACRAVGHHFSASCHEVSAVAVSQRPLCVAPEGDSGHPGGGGGGRPLLRSEWKLGARDAVR